jgi:hypothetical protein
MKIFFQWSDKDRQPSAWMPYVLISAIWAALFLGVGLYFGIEGDDIFIISSTLSQEELDRPWDYLKFASARYMLIVSSIGLYRLTGESPLAMQAIFFVIWLMNGWLCYLLLRRFYSWHVSLLSSLFFMLYSGKYEIVTVLSGGMYQVVIACCLLMLLVLTAPRLRWITKMLSFAGLLWISLHLYEILLPLSLMVPLYAWLMYRRGVITARDVLWSMLPIGVVALHLIVLSTNPIPIWGRSGQIGIVGYMAALPKVFLWSIDSLIGERHWSTVWGAWKSIYEFNLLAKYGYVWLATMPLVFLIVGTVIFAKSAVNTKSKLTMNFISGERNALILMALFLVVISPLITMPVAIGQGFVAPRFTYLPSLGLAFIAAHILTTLNRGRWVAIAIFTIWVVIEAVAMRSILMQYSTAGDYDRNILQQLEKYNLNPNPKDTFFVSLPENGLIHKAWRQGFSKFEQGGAQSLLFLLYPELSLYDKSLPLGDRLRYRGSVRPKGKSTDDSILGLFKSGASSPGSLYAFIMDENEKLCGVGAVEIIDAAGQVIVKKILTQFPIGTSACISTSRVPMVAVSNEWIDAEREINLYRLNERPLTLRFTAELFPNDPPLTAYLAHEGKVFATMKLTKQGREIWDIQLPASKAGEVVSYQLGNIPSADRQSRVIWKVQSLELLP